MNPMREVFVDKVVVHMGVGESGDKLTKAVDIMKKITGNNPVKSVAKKTNPAFGIRKGAPISCKVTLRGGASMDPVKLHQACQTALADVPEYLRAVSAWLAGR